VVLVGHGHFSRVLTARWLGRAASAGVGFKLDAGGITVLGDERGVPRLDHVNLVSPEPGLIGPPARRAPASQRTVRRRTRP
jgi:broad specificity phosphatase PhoE